VSEIRGLDYSMVILDEYIVLRS